MNISAGLVIPSKNAGARWADVIAGICSQQGVDLDVLVVDSGSTDQTLALARDAGFRVMEIPSSEFGHGATRQMALEQFRNHRWVLFMTQDAILCSPTSVLHQLR